MAAEEAEIVEDLAVEEAEDLAAEEAEDLVVEEVEALADVVVAEAVAVVVLVDVAAEEEEEGVQVTIGLISAWLTYCFSLYFMYACVYM